MKDPWLSWPSDLRDAATALIDLALGEDLGEGDLTAEYFSSDENLLQVRLVARQTGTLAGLPLFLQVLQRVSGGEINLLEFAEDGSEFAEGSVLARISGPAAAIHSAERTALNFLQRLSAVATRAAQATAKSVGPVILDTRKTTPGYRLLEKYAVRRGGGANHRMGLFDAVMVKDNHKEALGGMDAVMEKVAALPDGFPVYVEVDTLVELGQLLAHPAKARIYRILLDNFPPAHAAQAVALRTELGGGPDFEISGGLTVADLANSHYRDIEYASLGSLTHGGGAIDLALEVDA
ncbi:carboxylating nicotinate-nucleotide diphosphorylase [bacterium]|nr:carboxylating nicotinate-nucleotide diphosphorylase [bacterium]